MAKAEESLEHIAQEAGTPTERGVCDSRTTSLASDSRGGTGARGVYDSFYVRPAI